MVMTGHGGTGTVPDDHVVVLPRCSGDYTRCVLWTGVYLLSLRARSYSVRRDEPRDVRCAPAVVLGAGDVRVGLGGEDPRGEQGGQGALVECGARRVIALLLTRFRTGVLAPGVDGRRGAVCGSDEVAVRGDVGQDGGGRARGVPGGGGEDTGHAGAVGACDAGEDGGGWGRDARDDRSWEERCGGGWVFVLTD
jgi:hypothetical protein